MSFTSHADTAEVLDVAVTARAMVLLVKETKGSNRPRFVVQANSHGNTYGNSTQVGSYRTAKRVYRRYLKDYR
jgi:hypothetical protein